MIVDAEHFDLTAMSEKQKLKFGGMESAEHQ